MGVLLLAYTAHDLNRGEEGQIDHYSESSQCTVKPGWDIALLAAG